MTIEAQLIFCLRYYLLCRVDSGAVPKASQAKVLKEEMIKAGGQTNNTFSQNHAISYYLYNYRHGAVVRGTRACCNTNAVKKLLLHITMSTGMNDA